MDVMSLAHPDTAAREAAAVVAMKQGAPDRRRNRAGPGADFCHPPVRIVPHHDACGVASETLGRSGRNARAILEHRLPGLVCIGQDGGVHVPGGAGREPHAPREPGGTGAKAVAPAAARVELADEIEQARGGGVEVRGQLRDFITESIEVEI
jgi:hypothetical protein